MLKARRLLLWVLFLTALAMAIVLFMRPRPIYVPVQGMTLIAHAGGGLPQGVYSNAREALDRSVENGFTLIELDFNWTTNGELVLIHDWGERYYQYFSLLSLLPPKLGDLWPQQAKSAEKFSSLTMNHGLTQMTLDNLIDWLDKNPNIKIITDVKNDNIKDEKNDNIKALAMIKAKAGQHQGRFIVQIYAPAEYEQISNLGYQDIIFTAYRSPLNDGELVEFARQHHLFALTVPAGRASQALAASLATKGTPLYAHTLNTNAQAEALKNIGVTGLYTDYLLPAR